MECCPGEDVLEKVKDPTYQLSDFEPSPIFSVIFVILYVTAGVHMYHRWEGWDYSDSTYFIIISLTTIGFGDITPTKHPRFFIAASLYILVGLALVSMLINTLVIFVKAGYKKAKQATLELEQKARGAIELIIKENPEAIISEEFLKSKFRQYIVNAKTSKDEKIAP